VAEFGPAAPGDNGLTAFIDCCRPPLHDGAADIERLRTQAEGAAPGALGDDMSILRVRLRVTHVAGNSFPQAILVNLGRGG